MLVRKDRVGAERHCDRDFDSANSVEEKLRESEEYVDHAHYGDQYLDEYND